MSKVLAREAHVIGAQGTIAVVHVAGLRGNTRVISNITTRGTPKVAAKAAQTRVELFEYDGLGFDFADLLGDDPLGHLLKNKEALLDDFDAFGTADDFLLLDDSDRTLAEVAVIEVTGAVEVVKTAQGADSSPVVEGLRWITSNELRGAGSSRGGSNTGRKSGKSNNEGSSKFSKHDEIGLSLRDEICVSLRTNVRPAAEVIERRNEG